MIAPAVAEQSKCMSSSDQDPAEPVDELPDSNLIAKNSNLSPAKGAKNDEFYTQYRLKNYEK